MRLKLSLCLMVFAAVLTAQQSAELRGYAWSAEGRPIAGAKVTLRGAETRQVISAADGSFVVKGLKPGKYQITGDAAKEQLTAESPDSLELKPGQTAHADVTLGKSTEYHSRWSRFVRRLDGLH